MHAPFAPFADLAATLLAAVPAAEGRADGAHDRAHLLRVWHNAVQIAAGEGGMDRVLAAAVLLHDCVAVEKASPLRAQASRLAAERAGEILAGLAWPKAEIDAVRHAIAAHSFSANIPAETLPARILQDADRLDAIGAVGVARCFYTAGRMGSALYDPADPRAGQRALDDRAFAIDHFRAKLLKLGDGFQTGAGARLAGERTRRIFEFLSQFEEEIGA